MEERLASQQRAGNGPLCPTARFGPLYDQGQHRRDGRIDGSYADSMENHGQINIGKSWESPLFVVFLCEKSIHIFIKLL